MKISITVVVDPSEMNLVVFGEKQDALTTLHTLMFEAMVHGRQDAYEQLYVVIKDVIAVTLVVE